MPANLTPQAAIERGRPKPSECDFVVVILWSRLGTPLPVEGYRRPNGEQSGSGTEWEYEDALTGDRQPDILVYRRTEELSVKANDPHREAPPAGLFRAATRNGAPNSRRSCPT
jgi:hypothetical protein